MHIESLKDKVSSILRAAQAGGPPTRIPQAILDDVGASVCAQTGSKGGAFVWPALLRTLGRMDPGDRS